MRVCSLLPSATEIIAELGLIDSLVGVSEECRWPPGVVGKPVVTAARIDPSSLSSIEIDAAVRASLVDGGSLYAVDADLITELDPDLIVTQDLCAVCAVSSAELSDACPVGAEVLSLDPRTLGEVAASVRRLAARLDAVAEGDRIAGRMNRSIEETAESVRGSVPRRVFFAEWLDPPFCAGHWVPEMVALAGGRDVIGMAGTPSRSVTWEEVTELETRAGRYRSMWIRRGGSGRTCCWSRVRLPGGRGRRRQLLLATCPAARRRRAAARAPLPPRCRTRPRPPGDLARCKAPLGSARRESDSSRRLAIAGIWMKSFEVRRCRFRALSSSGEESLGDAVL